MGRTSGDRAAARAVAAEDLVADVVGLVDVADDDLGAFDHHLTAYGAGVVRGAGAAPAQRLDLQHLDPVGQFHQPLGAREQLGAEVGRDAEGVHVQAQVVHHARELVDLLRREELRLVGDHVVRAAAVREVVDEVGVEVLAVLDLHGVGDQAQPRRQLALARAVVPREDHARQAARRAVVLDLESQGRLPAVHRSGEEHQLGHGELCAFRCSGGWRDVRSVLRAGGPAARQGSSSRGCRPSPTPSAPAGRR